MDPIQRFGEYANAFEEFVDSNDESVLEPYFTEDAVYEMLGAPALAGPHEGRDEVFAGLKASLDGTDRRFDGRVVDLIEGPELRNGEVWLRWRATYTLEGAPDLVFEGEEVATFEGDRICRLEDSMPEDASEILAYMEKHADKLAG